MKLSREGFKRTTPDHKIAEKLSQQTESTMGN